MSLLAAVRSALTDIADKPLYLAYSGGVDSQCLLHVLADLRDALDLDLTAVHIHHGLQPGADEWLSFCKQEAARLGIAFVSQRCQLVDVNQSGVEAAARKARYEALADIVPPDAFLLTAQHQDDQAETLLLQLLRGAGPRGLAAMPAAGERLGRQIRRPLLTVSRAEIESYALEHGLQWREDPSNQDVRFDRNYLRHQLLPVIRKRWPQAAKTLTRSATLMAESQQLLDELAGIDAGQIDCEDSSCSVPLDQLSALSIARQRNLLRFLLRRWQFALPSYQKLEELRAVMFSARVDGQPEICWDSVIARRYQNRLYLTSAVPEQTQPARQPLNPPPHKTVLEHGFEISWQPSATGIDKRFQAELLYVDYRQGGEQFKPAGAPHHKPLKHWFQIWQVPPWLRQRIPLIYSDAKLLAVVGYAVSEAAVAAPEKLGWQPISGPVNDGPI